MSLRTAEREADVRRALDRVTDPELDEPVTELRFIERLTIDPDGDVSNRLPSADILVRREFAFLMAADMQREVGALPWVRRVRVRLGDHMYADKINHGLEHNLSFRATFGNEASAELDELRRTFLVKAFQRRQETLLRHLLKAGHRAEQVVLMSVGSLQAETLDAEGHEMRRRYLERRDVCARAGEQLAFVDAEGNPLDAETLPAYLSAWGRITINAEFNGALCRGLLAQRFREDGEPTLHDFARLPPKVA